MRITYDKAADALNIMLKKGKVFQTLEIAPEIFIDLDREGKPLYIEIVGASEKLGKRDFQTVTIGAKSIRLPIPA